MSASVVSAVQKWTDDGDRNSEYIQIDEEYEGEVPSDSVAMTVSGLFTFFLNAATASGSLSVSLPTTRGYGKSAALAEFVQTTNRAKAASISALLDAATKAYTKIADARDAEVVAEEEGEGADGDDDDDTVEDDYFVPPAQYNDPNEIARLEANKKLREMRELYQPTTTSLPAPTLERLLKDLTQVQRNKHHGWSAAPLNGDLSVWEVKLFDFDEGTPLQMDMQRLSKQTGETEVTLHMKFPSAYPNKPPFVRVIRPRFVFRTGRVTVGGSICTELLVQEGWQPVYDIESIIESLRQQITDREAGARVDLSNASPYTEQEAIEAFNRVAQQHGWSVM